MAPTIFNFTSSTRNCSFDFLIQSGCANEIRALWKLAKQKVAGCKFIVGPRNTLDTKPIFLTALLKSLYFQS